MHERFYIVLFIFSFLLPALLHGQYNSDNAQFQVDEKKGCAPFTFTVTHPQCLTGNCTVIFGDGIQPNQPFTSGDALTYTQPGAFTMKIVTSASVFNDQMTITVDNNTQPAFEVYSCGAAVQLNITDLQYNTYKVDFGDGTPEQTRPAGGAIFNYNYALPLSPTYTVSVRGKNANSADNCDASQKVVTTTLTATAISEIEVVDASTVELDHNTLNPSFQYRLMAATNNATSFQFVKPLYDPPSDTETLSGVLLPDNNFYCFRLDTYNPCSSTVAASSNVVCSINFDVVAQNNQNAISALTGAAASAYSLTRNGVGIPYSTLDTDVICNTDYTYQLRVNFGAATSMSMPKTVRAISTNVPSKVIDISAVVSETQVVLDWRQPAGFTAAEYTIQKIDNGNKGPIGTATTNTFTDVNYAALQCYTITYRDACGNPSPESDEACPIVLTGTLREDNTTDLSWTAYNGWAGGVDHYEIMQDGEVFDTTTGTVTSPPIENDPESQIHFYQIVAIPADGSAPAITPSASNMLQIIKAPNLYYPTAFTPNKDGLNDTFKVFSQFTANFEFKIFNRWGELMFITDDLTSAGWDGTYKGSPMPEGTYVFTAKITDFTGRTFDRSGTVLLLRHHK